MGCEDRAVIGKPLHRVRRADRTETPFDAAHHHVTDHLAGDACSGSNPADCFAIMAIESESDAHDLAVPAGELRVSEHQRQVRVDRRHLAVMLARSVASSMAFEQEAVLFHRLVDALCVDLGLTFESPLAL